MFGKVYETRRKTLAFGEVGYTYNGSGGGRTPEPFSSSLELQVLRARIAESVGALPNSCLANLYPDGLAGLGAHADNEPGIEHGSCLVMWLQTQKHYLHCIPTTVVDVSPRISLTFRVMT